MQTRKIAILTDSGSDVPADFTLRHGIFVAPLKIIYKDKEYNDRVNITPEEIYRRLEEEVPRTSLPDPDYVNGLFERMTAQGYDTVLIITISSGLSGTHNLLRMLAEEYGKLDVRMVDTLNIGIGSGQQVMLAADLLEGGADLDTVLQTLERSIRESRIYFCLDTLEYLAKGGRIGKVSALLGTVLRLRPVISCNVEGIYETVAKVRAARRRWRGRCPSPSRKPGSTSGLPSRSRTAARRPRLPACWRSSGAACPSASGFSRQTSARRSACIPAPA